MEKNRVNMVEIISAVSKKSGVPRTLCKKVIAGFEDVVIENVRAGRRVVIRSFGAFYRRDRKASVGRDVARRGVGTGKNPVGYGPKKQLAFRAITDLRNL